MNLAGVKIQLYKTPQTTGDGGCGYRLQSPTCVWGNRNWGQVNSRLSSRHHGHLQAGGADGVGTMEERDEDKERG